MYGDSLRDAIVGVIVVDPDALKKYAKTKGKGEDDNSLKTLLDDDLKKVIMDDILRLATANKLSSLEKPKELILQFDPFT